MLRNYVSTRDENIKATASEAVLNGIAPDGGLYVMKDIDKIKVNVNELKGMSYHEIAFYILNCMLTDFSESTLTECINKAYDEKFSAKEITPLVKVGEDFILELFHGKTSAFKDVALSILPYLITESLSMNNIDEEIIILTATSGDTGKAALEGFKDVKGTKIIVYYPEGGVSQVQKAQMVTQEGNNTYVCAVKGNFDDAQTGVKKIFTDENIKKLLDDNKKRFSSANSINVGRLVPQIVYYFYSYMNLIEQREIKEGEKVNFVVPTGNFGNILAGYYAKILGLPINKLICAANNNNVLYDFIRSGIYDANRDFYKTTSPSMDILISSNLERFLYYISGQDNKIISSLMKDLSEKKKYEVNDSMKEKLKDIFYSQFANEDEVNATIKKVYNEKKYLMDTHTAVAYKVLENYKQDTKDNTKNIILSTASPYKFAVDVYEAIFGKSNLNEFEIMHKLSEETGVKIPNNLEGLDKKTVIHNFVCEVASMDDIVKLSFDS